ncbi:dTDP-4-dehydrorhamnose reductase [Afifella sp. IM 167]|uniref:dTDP-4-dehydrorhamnose reductase n=1 Tax=Afifella sp. IM 167 TaxID=2033586 RepID=UPI001CC9870B|nr:dTDP-4-dehydrorhamnose reductase [Afifella sp. IM 167]
MRLLVTGRKGQVARALAERTAGAAKIDFVALGRPELDLAEPQTIAPAIEAARPDIVVSAAAYTAVDRAEDEPETAFAANARGAGEVAAAAARLGVPVIHLSTDYVFAGTGEAPHREDAPTAPGNVYGASKLAGEEAVAAVNPRHVILRTAWVYSPFSRNFVRTMLDLAETRGELAVVDDQWGNPTSALDIADAILAVAERWQAEPEAQIAGVYHLAGTGETSWCGLARAVFEASREAGGPYAEVRAITSAEYPQKAARPKNSRLASDRFEAVFGYRCPPWRTSVEKVVRTLLAERG